MADVSVKMPEEFMKRLATIGERQDEIVSSALEAGADVLEKRMRSALSSVVGKGTKYGSRSTGELLSALGTSPVGRDLKGQNSNIKVGFAEPHSGGMSNAMLANIIEYGKSGQPPKPFVKAVKSSAKAEVENAMRQKLEEELSKI